jgi:hypothetical protein
VSLKGQANSKPVVVAFAAVDDFTSERKLFFEGRDLCEFARLPRTSRNHASAMGTDVFGISQLDRTNRLLMYVDKVDNNSDREPLIHSSVEFVRDCHMAL